MSLLKKLALGTVVGILIGTPVGYIVETLGKEIQEIASRRCGYQNTAKFPPIALLVPSVMAGIFLYRAGIRHLDNENRREQ